MSSILQVFGRNRFSWRKGGNGGDRFAVADDTETLKVLTNDV